MALRKLELHASALSEQEYDTFTKNIGDITLSDDDRTPHDDAYYQNLTLSVREARAWLRGRYSHLPAATIDSILRFFSPNLSQSDMLSGGQFFAALRLVVHAESGKEVDRALAFIQTHPSSSPISRPSSPPKPQQASGSSRSVSDSTNPFSAHTQQNSNNPFFSTRSTTSARSHADGTDSAPSKLPPLPPRKPPPVPSFQPPPRHSSFVPSNNNGNLPPPPPPKPTSLTSALIKQSLIASKNGKTLKQVGEQLEKERVLRVLKSSESSSPFVNPRARSSSPNKIGSSTSSSSLGSESEKNPPPLPKRNKKPPSPPMSTTSFQQVALAATSTNPFNNMKSSSLQPSTSLDPPRYTQSPSSSPSERLSDLPPLPAGPPPKHPNHSYRKPPPSLPLNSTPKEHKRVPSFNRNSADSVTSITDNNTKLDFEAVYNSTPKTASPYVSTFTRAPSDFTPTRNRSAENTTGYFGDSPSPGRMFRSKSLHHPSSPLERSPFSPMEDESPFASPGTPPGPRRKRPESVQVLGSRANVLAGGAAVNGRSEPPTSTSLSRHMSISTPPTAPSTLQRQHQRKASSAASATSDSPLKSLAASLQPQLLSMQHQLQPHLDKARFKAEAGLSKRGFVRDPGSVVKRREEEKEGLMRDGSWEQAVQDEQLDSDDSDSDSGPGSQPRRAREINGLPRSMSMKLNPSVGGREHSSGRLAIEKDNLKWPVGEDEGWTPL